ncbi:MarR family transcriptional regulator [uncultured Kordia sp.]|uniref:MarR family winged helix-turn-helix transcriptional regulator n=1 Tax=uncultured Kordia sp. TaxID=507699 RepID=UPI002630CD83|nr:MarR family transcriptional regulator [uncultured Kordia sp.]
MINHNLYFQIEITARKIRHFGQSILNKYQLDITIEQWLVLKTILENEGVSQLRIGELLLKDKPTISRMIKHLVNCGYIKKENDALDLRKYSINLTDKGHELMDKLLPIIENIRLQGLNSITESEQTSLNNILLKIQNNIAK